MITVLALSLSHDLYNMVYHQCELNDIPEPSDVFETMHGQLIATWHIKGHFGTSISQQYLHDIKLKMKLLLSASDAFTNKIMGFEYSLEEIPTLRSTEFTKYDLSDFAAIEDLRYKQTDNHWRSNKADHTDDEMFDRIRNYAYSLKRRNMLDHDELMSYAEAQGFKEKVCKHKVASVYRWVRDNYKHTGEHVKKPTIPRKVNALIQSKQRSEDKIKAFKDYLTFIDPDLNEVSINQLAKAAKITWRSAKKYLMLFIRSIRGKPSAACDSAWCAAGTDLQELDLAMKFNDLFEDLGIADLNPNLQERDYRLIV